MQLNEDGTPMDRQAEVQALIQEQLQRSRGAGSRAPPQFTDPSRPGRAPMSEVRPCFACGPLLVGGLAALLSMVMVLVAGYGVLRGGWQTGGNSVVIGSLPYLGWMWPAGHSRSVPALRLQAVQHEGDPTVWQAGSLLAAGDKAWRWLKWRPHRCAGSASIAGMARGFAAGPWAAAESPQLWFEASAAYSLLKTAMLLIGSMVCPVLQHAGKDWVIGGQ